MLVNCIGNLYSVWQRNHYWDKYELRAATTARADTCLICFNNNSRSPLWIFTRGSETMGKSRSPAAINHNIRNHIRHHRSDWIYYNNQTSSTSTNKQAAVSNHLRNNYRKMTRSPVYITINLPHKRFVNPSFSKAIRTNATRLAIAQSDQDRFRVKQLHLYCRKPRKGRTDLRRSK